MKKSELRQMIREEILSVKSQERLDEGILSSIFGMLFKGATNREVKKIQSVLKNDKEYQSALNNFNKSYKVFSDTMDKKMKEYGIEID